MVNKNKIQHNITNIHVKFFGKKQYSVPEDDEVASLANERLLN